jgi:hypothetical protein
MRIHARRPTTAGLVLACVVGACGARGVESLGDGDTGRLSAEVHEVDAWQQRLVVRTRDGELGGVHFNQSTVVYSGQQQFPVAVLSPGDRVVLHVRADAAGELHAVRIDVRQTAPERAGAGALADLREFSGQVMQIDHLGGSFTLQTNEGMVTVTVPHHASRATLNHFQRLRSGLMVRLQASGAGSDRVELYRFY